MEKIDLSSDYDKYISYLESDIWAEKRNKALERDKYHCSICGNPNNLEVHHLRYPDVLGTELISDLMTLCRSCHKNMEEYKKGHKRSLRTATWRPPTKRISHWVQFKTKDEYLVFAEQYLDSDHNKQHPNHLKIFLKDYEAVKEIMVSDELIEYCKNNLDYKCIEEIE